jgi:hypothetical protein
MLPAPRDRWLRGNLDAGAQPDEDPAAALPAPLTPRRSLLLVVSTLVLWLLVGLTLAWFEARTADPPVAPSAIRAADATPAPGSAVPVAVGTEIGLGGGRDDTRTTPRRERGRPLVALRQERRISDGPLRICSSQPSCPHAA